MRRGLFDGPDGDGVPGPACLEFEQARDAAERGAADIADEGARNRALAAVSACTTTEQVQAVMRKVLANLSEQAKAAEKAKRARKATEDYVASAKAAHAENVRKEREAKAAKPNALSESRKKHRGAGAASVTREQRTEVIELMKEAFAPGTAPRALKDAIEEADYLTLQKHAEQLRQQIAAKAERKAGEPAPEPEVDLGEELPWEGEA